MGWLVHPCAAEDPLWLRYASGRSTVVRDALFERHRKLVPEVLARLGHSGDEDLEQVASLALVRAIERFDPTRGCTFATFAFPSIVGTVRRYLRDASRPIRPSRTIYDLRLRILATIEPLTAQLGHPPDLSQLATVLKLEPERIAEALETEDRCRPVPLSATRPRDEVDDNSPEDCLGTVDAEFDHAVDRIALLQALGKLPRRYRAVIVLHFYRGWTQRAIAAALGVSQMSVSRLQKEAFRQLRALLAGSGEAS